jgi:MoaA/NifB/PqqE/SkfB family radical SAM enzyme
MGCYVFIAPFARTLADMTQTLPAASIGTEHVALNLDLVGKLYQRSVYPQARKVALGSRLPSPLVVDLDPTTLCDLACPECISSNVLHNGQLSRDRIVTLAEELTRTNVRAVILIGGGEPLLHRCIGDVIRILHGAGIEIGLVTNGTLIGRHLEELSTMLSWVRVSIDAATLPTYEKFRPARGNRTVFPTIIDNMRALAAVKRGRLGYSFLLMQRFAADGSVTDSNYHEVLAAAKLAKDIGCDYFEIKAMLDEDHFTVNQRDSDVALVETQLAAVRELQDDSFHLLGSSNWEAVRREADPHQPKDYHTCGVAELRTTITPTGVFVCPYHRGHAKGRIGDISTTSFDELWAAADTSVIDPSTDCQFHCARHGTNLAIGAMAGERGPAAVVDDFDPFL